MMRIAAAALLTMTAACAAQTGDIVGAAAPVSDPAMPRAAPEGTAVALDQPVSGKGLVLTPLAVTEDSRCPADVQCVWSGEIKVRTLIEGDGWSETRELTAGRVSMRQGVAIMLAEVTPERTEGIEDQDYRFLYRVTDYMPMMMAK